MTGCKLLGLVEPRLNLLSLFGGVNQITWRKTNNMDKIEIPASGKFTKCIVFAAGKTSSITAGARKNKRTARKLANVHKDHLIPFYNNYDNERD